MTVITNAIPHPRQIRSFMRREGRMSPTKKQALNTLWERFGLEMADHPLNLDNIFQRSAPRILEIGFGMGQSFLEQAQKNLEQDFIGIEVHRPGIAAVLTAAEKHNLSNIKIFNADAVEVLTKNITENTLDTVQIFFPDPWPKLKHHKRRLIQPAFVELLWHKLKPNGQLHLATDWENYAQHMLKTVSDSKKFKNLSGENQFAVRPLTKFELRGKKLGHGVWDLIFAKAS